MGTSNSARSSFRALHPMFRPGLALSGVLTSSFSWGELSARAGLRSVLPLDVQRGEGVASFRWFAAATSLCLRFAVATSRVALAACGSAEFGQMRASGSDTLEPTQRTAPWGALGPGGGVFFHLWRRVSLFAEGELLFPLWRHSFLLGEEHVYAVPHLTYRAQIGIGIRIW
ncbi:MAG: hypothetical protein QM778_26435 [Myxococcales bacterium]